MVWVCWFGELKEMTKLQCIYTCILLNKFLYNTPSVLRQGQSAKQWHCHQSVSDEEHMMDAKHTDTSVHHVCAHTYTHPHTDTQHIHTDTQTHTHRHTHTHPHNTHPYHINTHTTHTPHTHHTTHSVKQNTYIKGYICGLIHLYIIQNNISEINYKQSSCIIIINPILH